MLEINLLTKCVTTISTIGIGGTGFYSMYNHPSEKNELFYYIENGEAIEEIENDFELGNLLNKKNDVFPVAVDSSLPIFEKQIADNPTVLQIDSSASNKNSIDSKDSQNPPKPIPKTTNKGDGTATPNVDTKKSETSSSDSKSLPISKQVNEESGFYRSHYIEDDRFLNKEMTDNVYSIVKLNKHIADSNLPKLDFYSQKSFKNFTGNYRNFVCSLKMQDGTERSVKKCDIYRINMPNNHVKDIKNIDLNSALMTKSGLKIYHHYKITYKLSDEEKIGLDWQKVQNIDFYSTKEKGNKNIYASTSPVVHLKDLDKVIEGNGLLNKVGGLVGIRWGSVERKFVPLDIKNQWFLGKSKTQFPGKKLNPFSCQMTLANKTDSYEDCEIYKVVGNIRYPDYKNVNKMNFFDFHKVKDDERMDGSDYFLVKYKNKKVADAVDGYYDYIDIKIKNTDSSTRLEYLLRANVSTKTEATGNDYLFLYDR